MIVATKVGNNIKIKSDLDLKIRNIPTQRIYSEAIIKKYIPEDWEEVLED